LNEWDPATEAESAMRDALAAADQDLYFRILSRTELLLPVSAEAMAGRVPMGWGTWTTGNRTHILAFTSPTALHLCLNEPSGSFRAVPFGLLAAEWPNYEWWLAINPGLPIEAYLPSWFVSQLTRSGDVVLPGRAMGASARMAQSDLAAAISGRVRATGPTRTNAPPPTPAPALVMAPPVTTPSAAPPPTPPPTPPRRPTDPVAARIGGSNGRQAPIETVDAEIIDYPPAAGSARVYPADAPGPPSGYDQPGYAGAGPAGPDHAGQGYRDPGYGQYAGPRYASQYSGTAHGNPGTYADRGGYSQGGSGRTADDRNRNADPDEATTRIGERDLGARLRERMHGYSGTAPAYGGATVGFSGERYGQPTTEASPSWTPRQAKIQDAEIVAPKDAWAVGFAPANETESNLLAAAETNNTDSFLSTLLLARVILPVPISMPPGSRPRDKYFPWQIEESDGQRTIAVFTSPERMAEHGAARFGTDISSMSMRFIELIGAWPSAKIQFAINPGSPVGATLPGSQIVALAAWAAEVGLRDEQAGEIVVAAKKNEAMPSMGVAGAPTAGAAKATVMQRTVPPSQLSFYLERGYDRVSGFVNRAGEVAHLTTPQALYRALGLLYSGSPFGEDDAEVHVLRWVAHRPDLYRLPYGGQHEAAMRAMQGWVIERPPFRGNGFAPGDTDVVAEFKVDSVRLPHGAQMWRLTRDGSETLRASFDADAGRWVPAP
jgi:SseB protein N-terminal domain